VRKENKQISSQETTGMLNVHGWRNLSGVEWDGARAGAFEKGIISGQGVWTYRNGDVYNGAFQDGLKHGQGCYHSARTHCQFIGNFEQGAFVYGRWIHRDGSYVLGTFVADKGGAGGVYVPSGPATCKFARPRLIQTGEFGEGMCWAGGAIMQA
jgi:hypothetical protein